MHAAGPDKQKHRRSRIYFIITWVFLFLFSLLWSIDESFIYTFLGGALLFLTLGVLSKPLVTSNRQNQPSARAKTRNHRPPQPTSAGFKDVIENIMTTLKSRQSVKAPTNARKFIIGVASFIVAVFLIIIIPVLLIETQAVNDDAVDHFKRAEQFRLNGEYDSADVYYQMAIKNDPTYAEALTGYGRDWLAREKYDSAMALFDKALLSDPDYNNARYGKALIYHYQQKYKQSLKVSLEIIDDSPDYLDAVLLAGDNYYVQQRYDSAMIFYEDGYKRGYRSAGLSHVMAYIHDTKGEEQKAIQLYKETLFYDSTRLEVYNRLSEFFTGTEGEFYRRKIKKLKEQGY